MGTVEDKNNQSYRYTWTNYKSHLSGVVSQLLVEECMLDVTLATEGGERIQAHRIVLCACSSLLQELLSDINIDNPTIVVSDVSAQDLSMIVEYTYHGQVQVPSENINSFLDAAKLLQILGLMDVKDSEGNVYTTVLDETLEGNTESMFKLNKTIETDLNIPHENENLQTEIAEATLKDADIINKKKRRRRDSARREYSEDMLESAILDLKSGHTLIEAATKYNIPRSTLYMRAKALGIQLNAARNEYPTECMKAAINAVIAGSSLQQASEMYSIPKTVLWRRIQKEGYRIVRSEVRKTYDSDKREAAVKALERGENLTKVAQEFQIPKTTLFRDKAKLIDEGKLPGSFLKKRRSENDILKKTRLEEAVAACRNGKMSQATASVTYNVPKTTIWRRLQQEGNKTLNNENNVREMEKEEIKSGTCGKRFHTHEDFEYCEISPISYIEDSNIPENSVIILTTDVNNLNVVENNKHLIVQQDCSQNYITCDMNFEESSTFETTPIS